MMEKRIEKNSYKSSGIYCIENIITNKKYIGSTSNFNKRYFKHLYELNNNKHPNKHLQNSYNIYGSINFKFYIIEVSENLIELENIYISKYKTNDKNFGYNKRIAAQSNKGISHNLNAGTRVKGKNLSKETKEKMSISRRGEKHNSAIINDEIAKKIKIMIAKGYRNINIANHFGLKKSIINDIKNGNGWGHIMINDNVLNEEIICKSTSRLNNDQVLIIKYLIKKGVTNHKIAKYLSIPNCIKEIKSGKTYKYIELDTETENKIESAIDLNFITSIKTSRYKTLSYTN